MELSPELPQSSITTASRFLQQTYHFLAFLVNLNSRHPRHRRKSVSLQSPYNADRHTHDIRDVRIRLQWLLHDVDSSACRRRCTFPWQRRRTSPTPSSKR